MRDDNLTVREITAVMVFFAITYALFGGLTELSRRAGPAIGLASVIVGIVHISIFVVYYALHKRFVNMNLYMIYRCVFGKILGGAAVFAIACFALLHTAAGLREAAEIIKLYNYPSTPLLAMTALLVAVCGFMAHKGLRPIAVVARGCFVVTLLGILAIVLVSYKMYDVRNIFPIFGRGYGELLSAGALYGGRSSWFFIASPLLFAIGGVKGFRRSGINALAISLPVLIICALCYSMAFNYVAAQGHVSGLLEMARFFRYNRFFHNLDTLFIFLLMICTCVSASASYYLFTHALASFFRTTARGYFVLIGAALILGAALVPDSYENYFLPMSYAGLVVNALLPTLALALAFARGKRGGIKSGL